MNWIGEWACVCVRERKYILSDCQRVSASVLCVYICANGTIVVFKTLKRKNAYKRSAYDVNLLLIAAAFLHERVGKKQSFQQNDTNQHQAETYTRNAIPNTLTHSISLQWWMHRKAYFTIKIYAAAIVFATHVSSKNERSTA